MEDIFQILIVVGLIGFSIVKQVLEKGKPDDETPQTMPQDEDGAPIYTPPVSACEMAFEQSRKPKRQKRQGVETRSAHSDAISTPPDSSPDSAPEPPAAVDVTNLDEVRRGIIWGEILQRKY